MTNTDASHHAWRTGPVGRTARGLAATVLAVLVSLNLTTFAIHGPSRYRSPEVLTDLSVWLGTAILAAAFIDFAGRFAPGALGRQPPRKAKILTAMAIVAIAAATAGLADHGSAWGFPLADVVWWFNNIMMAQIALSFAVAAAVGTPGCEQGVWQELRGRDRRGGTEIYACVVGLHKLDAWEQRHQAGRPEVKSAPDRSGTP